MPVRHSDYSRFASWGLPVMIDNQNCSGTVYIERLYRHIAYRHFLGRLKTIPPLLFFSEKYNTSTPQDHNLQRIPENFCNSAIMGSMIFNQECIRHRLTAGLHANPHGAQILVGGFREGTS